MTNTNKIAVVTGSNRGLGKSTALNLAKKGVDVIVTYHSNAEEATKVVAEIESLAQPLGTRIGAKAVVLQLDTANTKPSVISTGLTRIILPGYAAYASMKGAIETLTKYMAKELGSRKIAVNIVAPGVIETDFGGGGVRDNPEINQYLAAQTALGRVGLPDDIGGAITSLLSVDNQWVNAQRIEVSGGQSI
jgi:NAD(P)-dependent dehydrogenase (short-subunit alcohol dehydrogenase family)